MTFPNGFVGLAFREKGRDRAGVDCWGLARLVYQERGIDLPSYTEGYVSTSERAELDALLSVGAKMFPWVAVAPGCERELDIVVFRRGRLDAHVGIVVDRNRMLHVEHGRESCIERYDAHRWALKRSGIYRHAELA